VKKIAIVVSSDLPEPWPTLRALVADEDFVMLTRATRSEPERLLSLEALRAGIRVFAYPAKGGSDNWQRDVDLVRDADEVVVVLSTHALDNPESGAWHIAERAIKDDRPLRLYTVTAGKLVLLAES
jgi:hypothetical protein